MIKYIFNFSVTYLSPDFLIVMAIVVVFCGLCIAGIIVDYCKDQDNPKQYKRQWGSVTITGIAVKFSENYDTGGIRST